MSEEGGIYNSVNGYIDVSHISAHAVNSFTSTRLQAHCLQPHAQAIQAGRVLGLATLLFYGTAGRHPTLPLASPPPFFVLSTLQGDRHRPRTLHPVRCAPCVPSPAPVLGVSCGCGGRLPLLATTSHLVSQHHTLPAQTRRMAHEPSSCPPSPAPGTKGVGQGGARWNLLA